MKKLPRLFCAGCLAMACVSSKTFAQVPIAPSSPPGPAAASTLPPSASPPLNLTAPEPKVYRLEVPPLPDFRGPGIELLSTTAPIVALPTVPTVVPPTAPAVAPPTAPAVVPPTAPAVAPLPAAQVPTPVEKPLVPVSAPTGITLPTPAVTPTVAPEPAKVETPNLRDSLLSVPTPAGILIRDTTHGAHKLAPKAVPPTDAQPSSSETAALALKTDLMQLVAVLSKAPCADQREMAAHNLTAQDPKYLPTVIEVLTTAARNDMAPTVRAASVRALARMNDHSAPVIAAVQLLQTDPDPVVRTEAERAQRLLAQSERIPTYAHTPAP